MDKVRIGKTMLTVETQGCHDCGTRFSFSWHVLKTVHVQVGRSIYEVSIPLCGDCWRQRTRGATMTTTMETRP